MSLRTNTFGSLLCGACVSSGNSPRWTRSGCYPMLSARGPQRRCPVSTRQAETFTAEHPRGGRRNLKGTRRSFSNGFGSEVMSKCRSKVLCQIGEGGSNLTVEDWLKKIPAKRKALYSHSLPCIEAWLQSLGFVQGKEDRSVWNIERPDWHALLSLDVTDLYVRSSLSLTHSFLRLSFYFRHSTVWGVHFPVRVIFNHHSYPDGEQWCLSVLKTYLHFLLGSSTFRWQFVTAMPWGIIILLSPGVCFASQPYRFEC